MQSYKQYRQVQASVKEALKNRERDLANLAADDLTDCLIVSSGHLGTISNEKSIEEGDSRGIIIVTWDSEDDPSNPRNFPLATKVYTTLNVAAIAMAVGIAGAIDAAVAPQAAMDLHISEVAESMAVGAFLIGFGCGAVLAAPFSELFGRNIAYCSTLIVFSLFIMACGLAPNFGAQIALRFLAGIFGSTPLVCAGGSIADMWDSLSKTWAFPLYAVAGFPGPALGPVLASFVGQSGVSWRWAEWITLLFSVIVIISIINFMPETYGPLILKWKAEQLRKQTGDNRYKSEFETRHVSLSDRLKVGLIRPFQMAREPIIVLLSIYLTVLYIILFTFLNGYKFIFTEVYGVSQGITNVIFLAMYVGMLCPSVNIYPIYKITKRLVLTNGPDGKSAFQPEVRLWYGMLGGSISIPIALLWMGWTDYPSISIWSPILASILFGFGMVSIFICTYMYVIDAYEIYAASALTLVTFLRYVTAGSLTAVGIPFYKNMGVHWTLTILACISILLVPIPFVFYKYGHKIRSFSKHAVVY
ncbi:major facilitator superfamily domain-containing protein [Dipodascopsis uninucleata]